MGPLLLAATLVLAPRAADEKKPRILIASIEGQLEGGALRWRDGPDALLREAVAQSAARAVKAPPKLRKAGEDLARWIFDVDALAPLGRRAKADVVLAVSMRLRWVRGDNATTVRGTGEVMALDVASAQKLAALSLQASGEGADDESARAALYRDWGERFNPILERKVLQAWALQAERGAAFRVTLSGGRAKQRKKWTRALERVPKVVDVRTLSELDGRLSLEVRFRGSGEGLVRAIFQHLARKRPFRGLTRVGRQTTPIQLEFSR